MLLTKICWLHTPGKGKSSLGNFDSGSDSESEESEADCCGHRNPVRYTPELEPEERKIGADSVPVGCKAHSRNKKT